VVASAGNDDDDACNYAPANIPDVVTVAASNSFDVRASFSNYGDCVDFFAPGELIISTYLDNEMIHMSGTSMAAQG